MSQDPATHMEEQLGWARRLGGVESLEMCKAGHTVLARLVESRIWLACSAQSGKMWFFNSVVVRLPFNSVSDSSE